MKKIILNCLLTSLLAIRAYGGNCAGTVPSLCHNGTGAGSSYQTCWTIERRCFPPWDWPCFIVSVPTITPLGYVDTDGFKPDCAYAFNHGALLCDNPSGAQMATCTWQDITEQCDGSWDYVTQSNEEWSTFPDGKSPNPESPCQG